MSNPIFSVLLVDDDPDDQFFFKESLLRTQIPIHLSTAFSGMEAMHQLASLIPDFIFLDINMPGQNGKDFLRTIRTNEKFNDVSVIMFTTSFSEIDIDICFQYGANLYVAKPLSTAEQTKILQKIFSMYQGNRPMKPKRENFVFSLH